MATSYEKMAAEGRSRDQDEASRRLRLIADGLRTELVKLKIAHAADRLGWPLTRTEDMWRSEASRIEAWELDQLREWLPEL